MTSPRPFQIGDQVIIDPAGARPSHHGVTYTVVDILRVNVLIEPVAGGPRTRVNPRHLRHAAAATAASTTPADQCEQPLPQGTLVTVTATKIPADQLYVVLRDNGAGKTSIVKLGGDAGRYWRNVARSHLTVIDPGRLHLDPAPGS